MTAAGRFDEGGHVAIHLTAKAGPAWDKTLVYCTCGWQHTYKTSKKALRRKAEHEAAHKEEAA